MKKTQKTLAMEIIQLTLHGGMAWLPTGTVTKKGVVLSGASSMIDNKVIVVNFNKQVILINRKRQRYEKELSSDLLSIIKIKVTKMVKKNVKIN